LQVTRDQEKTLPGVSEHHPLEYDIITRTQRDKRYVDGRALATRSTQRAGTPGKSSRQPPPTSPVHPRSSVFPGSSTFAKIRNTGRRDRVNGAVVTL